MLRVCRRPDARKGWAKNLLIVAACCVHARRENRFEVEARNIIHIMPNLPLDDILHFPGMSFFDIPTPKGARL
jgi:hypothetical protein